MRTDIAVGRDRRPAVYAPGLVLLNVQDDWVTVGMPMAIADLQREPDRRAATARPQIRRARRGGYFLSRPGQPCLFVFNLRRENLEEFLTQMSANEIGDNFQNCRPLAQFGT